MKIHALAPLALSLSLPLSEAFAPQRKTSSFVKNKVQALPDAASILSIGDALHHMPSLLLSDEAIADAVDAVSSVTEAVAPAVAPVADVAPEVAETATNNGWFGFLAGPIEGLLQTIHSLLVTVGLNVDSWGVSITIMTVVIKLATYPLTKIQLESTNKMQVLQPVIKDIQAKYQSNPDVMNQKIAEIYQTNEVNPLAGCLPAFLQIPIFIGLYRSVLNLAKEDKLNEPYLWLPNLEGPVYGADPANGSDWIFKGWVDGVPSLGWEDTLAFLTIPVILIVSQFISQSLMQPKDQPQAAQQNQVILKVLPLMVGWFSLNVPAALGIYWITNNVITTLLTLQIRSSLPAVDISTSSGSASTVSMPDMNTSDWSPSTAREKPAGFGSVVDDVKPITAIDAEIVENEVESTNFDNVIQTPTQPASSSKKRNKKKKRGGKKK